MILEPWRPTNSAASFSTWTFLCSPFHFSVLHQSLEDYLQDIVGLDPETAAGAASLFSSDGTPNFSQAALLLQNSTNVYGRKVEYLYALVYAALDDLVASSAHAKQQKTKGTDAEIDDFEAFDTEFQFLLLELN